MIQIDPKLIGELSSKLGSCRVTVYRDGSWVVAKDMWSVLDKGSMSESPNEALCKLLQEAEVHQWVDETCEIFQQIANEKKGV